MSLKLGSKTINAFYTSVSSTKIVPTGVFDIPSRSGTYNVKSYAFARAEFPDDLVRRLDGTLTSYSNSSITTIGPFAFAGLDITSVSIPAVTQIGSSAFRECSSLTSINLPACTYINPSAFASCVQLTSVNIPQCSRITGGAFQNCTNLTNISLFTSVSLAGGTFSNCTALSSFPFSRITHLGDYEFYSTALTGNISLASTITSLGTDTFGFTQITSIYGPNIQSLHATRTFESCSQLVSAIFPNCSLLSGYGLFVYCTSLSNVSLPECVAIAGTETFAHCTSLSTINLPKCSTLGTTAFYNCSNLQSISLPSCITIGNTAFQSCHKLKSIFLPVCTTLGYSTFMSCDQLSSVKMPMVSYIPNSCFRYCTSLMWLEISSTTMVTLSNVFAFYSTPMSNSTYTGSFGKIVVAPSLVDAYKTATNWTTFSNRIVGYPGT